MWILPKPYFAVRVVRSVRVSSNQILTTPTHSNTGTIRRELPLIESTHDIKTDENLHLRLARRWLAIGTDNDDTLCDSFLRVVANEPRIYDKLSESSKISLRATCPSIWERDLFKAMENEDSMNVLLENIYEEKEYYLAIPRLHVLAVHTVEMEVLKGTEDSSEFWNRRAERGLCMLHDRLKTMLSMLAFDFDSNSSTPGSMGWWRHVATRMLSRRSMARSDYDYRGSDCIRDAEKIVEDWLDYRALNEFVETLSTRKDQLDFWLYLLRYPKIIDYAMVTLSDGEPEKKFVKWYLQFACAIVLERCEPTSSFDGLKSRVVSRSITSATRNMANDLFERIETAGNDLEKSTDWINWSLQSRKSLPCSISSRMLVRYLRGVRGAVFSFKESLDDFDLSNACRLDNYTLELFKRWRDESADDTWERQNLTTVITSANRGRKRPRQSASPSEDTKRKRDVVVIE